jgi:hypothetical protein
MKFSMKDLNPGTWFYFDPNDSDSGKICIRILNSGKLAEIRDKTITTEYEYKNGQRYENQKINHALRDTIIWDYCIVNWQGLIDDDEKPIECTTENKLKLMNDHVGFSSFVENCMDQLNQEVERQAEYSEKNLSSTQGQD